MNPDDPNAPVDRPTSDFEGRLARLPLRPAPGDLRGRVLQASTRPNRQKIEAAFPPSPSAITALVGWLRHHLSVASGSLTACWLVIGLLAGADRWLNRTPLPQAARASTDQIAAARSQRQELLLFAGIEARPATPRRVGNPPATPPATRPRGEWRSRSRDGLVQTSPDLRESSPLLPTIPPTAFVDHSQPFPTV